jgi:hypothetical protein
MLFIYAWAMLHSAALLFVVQPLVGKMILPALGGSPAVWNTCMLFFQFLLLAGYSYAHVTRVWLGARRQAALHLALMLLPLLVLPIAINTRTVPQLSDNPLPWLLGCLASGVGLPFLIVSAHAPMLQYWFSRTNHASARDPYFLYAASNAGSLAALLGYPILIEPRLAIIDQSRWWMYGYIGMIALAAACAIVLWRSAPVPDAELAPVETATTIHDQPVDWRRRLRWLVYAFVPSSAMLGVTAHLSTDLAPVPLLWVVPLALYLLTFIIAFAQARIIPRTVVLRGAMLLLVPTTLLLLLDRSMSRLLLAFPLHLVTFFLVALAFHGELADDRPAPSRLTQFYLIISLGGVLGGVFNALIAPIVFSQAWEYPILLVAATLLLPRAGSAAVPLQKPWGRLWAPLAAAAVIVMVAHFSYRLHPGQTDLSRWVMALPMLAAWILWSRPLSLGVLILSLVLSAPLWADRGTQRNRAVERNFYGVKRVEQTERKIGLVHGRTVHGSQWLDASRRNIPLTYYHPAGPVGDLFQLYFERPASSHIAVVGLGIGSLASYVKPDMQLDYYEIDPQIARLAQDTRYFHFLEDCAGTYKIILGDGRLTLATAPDHSYGAILLDAFSSDAIPTHLLTREAMQLYVRKLARGGFIGIHVSNNYLRLGQIVSALSKDAGLICRTRFDLASPQEIEATGRLHSQWVIVASSETDLGPISTMRTWGRLAPFGTLWTDQFTDIWRAIRLPEWAHFLQ